MFRNPKESELSRDHRIEQLGATDSRRRNDFRKALKREDRLKFSEK